MLPWSSIFSENVSTTLRTIESWISSMFFILFLLTIGPWFVFLAYDVLLYVFRTITYEIPVLGGRARGKERPRAPSLKERATGDPRVMGIGVPAATYVEQDDVEEERRRTSGDTTPDNDEYRENTSDVAEKSQQGEPQHVPTPLAAATSGAQAAGPADTKTDGPHALDSFSLTQEQTETGGDSRTQFQRIFSIGGAEERPGLTEENARRRVGFEDDDGPG